MRLWKRRPTGRADAFVDELGRLDERDWLAVSDASRRIRPRLAATADGAAAVVAAMEGDRGDEVARAFKRISQTASSGALAARRVLEAERPDMMEADALLRLAMQAAAGVIERDRLAPPVFALLYAPFNEVVPLGAIGQPPAPEAEPRPDPSPESIVRGRRRAQTFLDWFGRLSPDRARAVGQIAAVAQPGPAWGRILAQARRLDSAHVDRCTGRALAAARAQGPGAGPSGQLAHAAVRASVTLLLAEWLDPDDVDRQLSPFLQDWDWRQGAPRT